MVTKKSKKATSESSAEQVDVVVETKKTAAKSAGAAKSPASKNGGAKARSASPDTSAIAQRAWEIWQSEGCPEGRDLEHWLRAEEELSS